MGLALQQPEVCPLQSLAGAAGGGAVPLLPHRDRDLRVLNKSQVGQEIWVLTALSPLKMSPPGCPALSLSPQKCFQDIPTGAIICEKQFPLVTLPEHTSELLNSC